MPFSSLCQSWLLTNDNGNTYKVDVLRAGLDLVIKINLRRATSVINGELWAGLDSVNNYHLQLSSLLFL